MNHYEITVSVDGGFELDQAALIALINSLPGLSIVPLDNKPPPNVLVWEARTRQDQVQASVNNLPSVSPDTAVLLLIDDAGFDSLPETVTGLLSRNEPPAALGLAIRQVARGEQYLSPSLAMAILQKQQSKSRLTESQKSIIESLTVRESEILGLLAQGLSSKMIAAKLYLSVRTVEGHLANIYSRLGVHSRTEAMLIAVNIR